MGRFDTRGRWDVLTGGTFREVTVVVVNVRDVVLGTCTCTRVQLEYRFQVLVLVLVLEG